MPSAAPSLVAPAWHWAPSSADTLGPEVAELATLAGFEPDPEQREALDLIFAFNGMRVACRDVAVVCPRQNMKTGLLKMAALGWLFITEDRLIVWSAHEFGTAQEAFRDMQALIESTPDLAREVKHIHRTAGAEAIELRGDRRLRFKARTKGGGRGLTGDRIVLDEAMYLKPDHMGALVPTLRAVPDPQVVYAGSAGMLQSDIWRSVRDRGRAGDDPTLGYLEWGDRDPGCASDECLHSPGTPGCGLDDEARWWATNPALGRRIDIESLRADRRTLPPGEFARETLGWWEDPPTTSADPILTGWEAASTSDAPTDPVWLGVDVSADMRGAAIVACGGGVLEVVDYRRSGGTAWLEPRLAALRERHGVGGVSVAAGSPAGALGLPDVDVVPSGVAGGACMALAQDINDGLLRHRGQEPLDISVRAAVRRISGDGWRWSRAQSPSDISPLWAAVLARHGWAQSATAYDPLSNFMPNM